MGSSGSTWNHPLYKNSLPQMPAQIAESGGRKVCGCVCVCRMLETVKELIYSFTAPLWIVCEKAMLAGNNSKMRHWGFSFIPRFIQGYPTTVFCKISVRRSKYCLEFSIAWDTNVISQMTIPSMYNFRNLSIKFPTIFWSLIFHISVSE